MVGVNLVINLINYYTIKLKFIMADITRVDVSAYTQSRGRGTYLSSKGEIKTGNWQEGKRLNWLDDAGKTPGRDN